MTEGRLIVLSQLFKLFVMVLFAYILSSKGMCTRTDIRIDELLEFIESVFFCH